MLPGSHFFAPERHAGNDLVLRSALPGDGARLADALNASFDHLKRFMQWSIPEENPNDCESRCRRFRARYLTNEDFVLFILDSAETRILGGSGLHLREGPVHEGRAEIGMWIRGDEAGTGLGTRALVELLRWSFTDWPFYRLSWKCSTANPASRRIAEKAGMVLEATQRRRLEVRGESPHDQLSLVAFRDEWTPPSL